MTAETRPQQPVLVIGVRINSVEDIRSALTTSSSYGFGFLCTTVMTQSKVASQLNGSMEITEPFSWSDMALSTEQWQRGVVAEISNLETQFQSNDSGTIKRAAEILYHQISFAQHIRVPAILIELTKDNCTNLANFLNNKLTTSVKNQYTVPHNRSDKYWVKIPMAPPAVNISENANDNDNLSFQDMTDPWNVWNTFRLLCGSERLLYVALELTSNAPDEEEVDRWLGEPVKAVFISKDVFITNTSGYPVLSKIHQKIIKQFIKVRAQIVIDAEILTDNLKFYKQYIQYLEESLRTEPVNTYELFTTGYEDILQFPLQPLKDNLESGTYEVFEKDPIKYRLYGDAAYLAMKDRVPEEERSTTTLVVMVVGAGRGPLVRAALVAAASAGVNIRVYAVEKNANAANTLFHIQKTEEVWKEKVTVVCQDMRLFNPSEKADIMISELLGSFGDNELSPECLDGAQRFLKEDGIMIPKNYTSFIAPIMSSRAHQEAGMAVDPDKYKYAHFETAYVIQLRNKYDIAKPQRLFTFEHPNSDAERTNDRYEVRKFVSKQDCVLHGFVGYFESVLYGDIMMSTHPPTHTPTMFSWFPMYFPIKEPVQIKDSQEITLHFWRKSSNIEVWYEWTVTSPFVIDIHNPSGRSSTFRL